LPGYLRFNIFTPTLLLFRRLALLVLLTKTHVSNSQLVYLNVYTNKKTNHPDLTPSGWLSTVGPAGLEPRPAVKKCSGGAF
jgi:hypothetical protein